MVGLLLLSPVAMLFLLLALERLERGMPPESPVELLAEPDVVSRRSG